MRRPGSPQSRFLLRASLFFAAMLLAWWFVLLGPLLAWTRVSTDVALNVLPGATLKTGATVNADGVWVVQAPVKVAGAWRNIRVEAGRRLPTQLTIGIPLFWAILLAAPRPRERGKLWRIWAAGSAILLAIPPAGLLLYAAHVIQMYVFPAAAPPLRAIVAAADYFTSTAAPYLTPVLAAVALHPEFRHQILTDDSAVPDPSGGQITLLP
jgi:hypothetical protein